jgi:protein-S-isoprenylcysteine O-methyltransferase Ste14
MNTPLDALSAIVFAIVFLCWMIFAIAFILRRKPNQATTERKRARASILGIILQALSFAIIWSAPRQMFTQITSLSEPLEVALAALTVALAVGSVWITASAVRTLGKEWSLTARVVEDHRLITSGPYRFVRHPIYTGMFGLLIATGLAYSHWIAFFVAIAIFTTGTIIRVRSEEKLLRETFGHQYDLYARRVPMILPFSFRKG